MLWLEGQPLHPLDEVRVPGSVIQLGAFWHCCQEERHTIVVQAAAPLSHRRVYRIENMVCVVNCGIT